MSVVYIHIGLPKTGTTHLQDRLWRNRDLALRSSGLLYPGNVISDHFHAAVHLQPERYLDWVDPAFESAWPALLGQIRAWPQTSLLSHELFSTATEAHISRLLDDLSFVDEVHVIATVRDLGRQLPSVWQENVKNQHRANLDDFVSSVQAHARTPRGSRIDTAAARATPMLAEEPFWEFQDYGRILKSWADAVGPERVHLVTVPQTRTENGDGLWERFLRVLDVDPAPLTISVPSLNSSLSAPQAEFLRRLNERLQPGQVDWRRYERVIKGQVIGEILFADAGGAAQGLGADHRAWVADHADAMIAEVRAAGYRVVGDLDDLTVSRQAGADAAVPSDVQVLGTALDTLAAMVQAAPLPAVGPRWKTRAANVVRRGRRRVLGLRRSFGAG